MSVAQYSLNQYSPSTMGQSQYGASSQNKQVLKEIKEILEKEFTDIQQVNTVIIKLSQRKNLSLNDLDAAREMMRINYRKNSLSVTKQVKKQDLLIVDNNNNNVSQIQKIKPQKLTNLEIDNDHLIAKSQTINKNMKPLKIRGNLSTNNRNATKIVLPLINGSSSYVNNVYSKQPTIQKEGVSDLMNLNLTEYKTTDRGQEVILEQKLKLQDPWRLLINDDLSKFELEQQYKLSTKRNSQANYKDYLEKQMQSQQAQKQFMSQVNVQEGDTLKSTVKRGDQVEKEKFQSYREKIKGIMEQNDQTKVSLLQQQQKLKIEQQEREKKEAIDKDMRDKQQIQEEQMAIKLKQRKVSSDLDFIRAQHQQIKHTLQSKNKLQINGGDSNDNSDLSKLGLNVSYSHTNKHSPRAVSTLDDDINYALVNPFVDKAGIIKHRSRIQELTARNQYNAQVFDKYTVSPKDQNISKLEQSTVNFQTILDERNKKYKNESKNLHKKYITDNQSLSVMKTKVKIESHQNEIDQELQLAKLDVENSIKHQQDAIQDKLQKQRYVQLTLQEQINKNKDQKFQIAKNGDLSPTEIALNKQKLQHIDIWNPRINNI